jgi:hypothetical protein
MFKLSYIWKKENSVFAWLPIYPARGDLDYTKGMRFTTTYGNYQDLKSFEVGSVIKREQSNLLFFTDDIEISDTSIILVEVEEKNILSLYKDKATLEAKEAKIVSVIFGRATEYLEFKTSNQCNKYD